MPKETLKNFFLHKGTSALSFAPGRGKLLGNLEGGGRRASSTLSGGWHNTGQFLALNRLIKSEFYSCNTVESYLSIEFLYQECVIQKKVIFPLYLAIVSKCELRKNMKNNNIYANSVCSFYKYVVYILINCTLTVVLIGKRVLPMVIHACLIIL